MPIKPQKMQPKIYCSHAGVDPQQKFAAAKGRSSIIIRNAIRSHESNSARAVEDDEVFMPSRCWRIASVLN